MKARTYSERDFLQILKDNGYYFLRNDKGDHQIFTNGVDKITINKKLNKMVARKIIKNKNLKV